MVSSLLHDLHHRIAFDSTKTDNFSITCFFFHERDFFDFHFKQYIANIIEVFTVKKYVFALADYLRQVTE